ncbi:MAG: lysophospholipase [Clostridia bacterium]|nr:lysophospholipase [Clostridia bacterium]
MSSETPYTQTSANRKNTLHGIAWIPEDKPRAILLISHGMAEHIRRYKPFMEYLADRGILTLGHDHIGHGKSVDEEKELGYLPWAGSVDTLVDDVLADAARIKEAYPDVPLILLGHSMGSFVARLAAAKDKAGLFSALIVMGTGGSNPAAGVGLLLQHAISGLFGERHVSRLVEWMMFGSYNKRCSGRTIYDWLSTDEEQVDKYIADPLSGYPFTVSALGIVTTLSKEANRKITFAETDKARPIFLISGGDDPVGGYGKGVSEVYKNYQSAGVSDIAIKLFPGCRHEILNERCREEVYETLYGWIDAHLHERSESRA